VACDTDNNKLHNEKTPQLTKVKDMIGLNGRVHFKHRGRKKFLGLRQVAG
jgi:hypothetical protein